MVTGFVKKSSLQRQTIAHVVDNCSAHNIDYDQFENPDHVMLSPNMTSKLQPVNAAIGRSFKCAFRRQLAGHILSYVEKEMKKNP